MEMSTYPHIAIVIVLFHPTKNDLDNVHLLANKYEGVIIDNSEIPAYSSSQIGLMHYIPLQGNKGIAEAHNRAIDLILHERQAQYIILLDQDSRLNEDYPQLIVNEFQLIKKHHPQLAALGPTIIQKETGEEYKSAIHHDMIQAGGFILKKDIIASGCCFDIQAFTAIGYFESLLFIDFVDTEWCYRAQSKGFICGITTNVQLNHKVGLGEIHIGKHIVSVSAPFRYYYQYRNFIILTCRNYIPLSFKTNFGIKYFLRFFYLPFVVQQRWAYWKYMLKGIGAGLKIITTNKKI